MLERFAAAAIILLPLVACICVVADCRRGNNNGLMGAVQRAKGRSGQNI